MGYDVEFKYVKGKDLFIADALSRSQPTNQHISKIEQEIETTRLVHEEQSLTSNFADIAEATAKDVVLQSVIDHISMGWKSSKRNVPVEILPYWNIKDELSFNDAIIYRGDRIVVPATLRKTLIIKLHQAHMGTGSTLRRASENFIMVAGNEQSSETVHCYM